jgi:small subunit ribosomal protein S21
MAQKPFKKPSKNSLDGSIVYVGDAPFDVAFRKFKRKIESSNLLRELQDRETYTKPTTSRKQKRAAAVKRWKKELAKTKLPPKMY